MKRILIALMLVLVITAAHAQMDNGTAPIADDIAAVEFTSGKAKAMPYIPLLLLSEEPQADFWVDSSEGSNANPGTKNKPFKTISHALSFAGEN